MSGGDSVRSRSKDTGDGVGMSSTHLVRATDSAVGGRWKWGRDYIKKENNAEGILQLTKILIFRFIQNTTSLDKAEKDPQPEDLMKLQKTPNPKRKVLAAA